MSKNESRTLKPEPLDKADLARLLAERSDTTPAVAADELDAIIFAVLKKLKEGKPAAFPGLGRIASGQPKAPGKASK